MLKKRIVAVLVVKGNIVVQSIGFERYLPVGRPAIAVEFLNQWGIDEIILLDITATRNGRDPNFAMVRSQSNDLDAMGRLLKKPDTTLEALLYLKIEKEVI